MAERKSLPEIGFKYTPTAAELLEQSLTDEKLRRKVRVVLHVGGGMSGQSYRFHFEADGRGRSHCQLECKLTDRTGDAKTTIEPQRFEALLRKIHNTGVCENSPEQPSFLPDTVVGRLEISIGDVHCRTYFAADADQAQVQNKQPPAALLRAVDAIYAEGARMLRKRKHLVKP